VKKLFSSFFVLFACFVVRGGTTTWTIGYTGNPAGNAGFSIFFQGPGTTFIESGSESSVGTGSVVLGMTTTSGSPTITFQTTTSPVKTSPAFTAPLNGSASYVWDIAANTITNVTSPQYTNFTYTIVNTTASVGAFSFYYNGTLQQAGVIQPGGSVSWTTPNIEVYPVPGNFTEQSNFNPQQALLTAGTDGSGNPTFGFSNLVYGATTTGSGAPGTTTYSGAGGTDVANGTGGTTLGGSPPLTTTSTNTLSFGTPSGAATESTLERFANQDHTDLGQLLTGNGILHADLGNAYQQQMFVTNELGVIAQYTRSNSDQAFQFDRYLTNLTDLAQLPTNSPDHFTSLSNFQWVEMQSLALIVSNTGVGVNISNILSITNQIALDLTNEFPTNFATEVTQSNILYSLTNGSSTNPIPSALDAASLLAGEGSNDIGGLAIPEMDETESYGDALDGWTVDISFLGSGWPASIDLNPFHVDWVVALAGFFRSVLVWISASSLYLFNITTLAAAVFAQGGIQQARYPKMSTLADGLAKVTPGGVWAVSIAVAVAITTLMLAIPLVAVAWFTTSAHGSLYGILTVNPFHGVHGGPLGQSIYIVDQFFPIAFMFYCITARIFFTAILGGAVWVCNICIRFLVSA
jgi:hypothetical protein